MSTSSKRWGLALALGGLLGLGSQSASALYVELNDFTGDDAQIGVEVTNQATGVQIQASFTAASANTGDITGFWIGLDDDLFDPASINLDDIEVVDLPTGVTFTASLNNGTSEGALNLQGEGGYILQFDLDILLAQDDEGGNDIIDSLTINIATAGLTESVFNAFGARVQSSGPNGQGSSKLAGGVSVSEPAALGLFGIGLVGVALARRRRTDR